MGEILVPQFDKKAWRNGRVYSGRCADCGKSSATPRAKSDMLHDEFVALCRDVVRCADAALRTEESAKQAQSQRSN